MVSRLRNPLCYSIFTLLILTSILQVVTSSCRDRGTCRKKFSIKALKKMLTPLQYKVTQERGTERAFTGDLLYNQEQGEYDCRVCDNPLFSSEKKYDSGAGWPTFFDVISQNAISLTRDTSAGKVQNEASCNSCGSHLGQVFDDASQPSGKRYLMNSAALKFKKFKKLGRRLLKGLRKNLRKSLRKQRKPAP